MHFVLRDSGPAVKLKEKTGGVVVQIPCYLTNLSKVRFLQKRFENSDFCRFLIQMSV